MPVIRRSHIPRLRPTSKRRISYRAVKKQYYITPTDKWVIVDLYDDSEVIFQHQIAIKDDLFKGLYTAHMFAVLHGNYALTLSQLYDLTNQGYEIQNYRRD